MKKIISILLVCLMLCAAQAEEVLPQETLSLEEETSIEIVLPERSVSVCAIYEEPLHFGDTIILHAVLEGYENTVYTIQWQVSKDNANWQNIEGAASLSYSFIITENNYQNYYRIAVTLIGIEVAD